MKRRFSSFIGMILVCAVTIAQTSISLLPKPQLYKDTGKNFTMGSFYHECRSILGVAASETGGA